MNNRDAWIEISVANIKYNIQQIQVKAGDSKLVGVIKADAYGHGAVNYAKVLDEQGVDTFAVATIPEAIQLREAGFFQPADDRTRHCARRKYCRYLKV